MEGPMIDGDLSFYKIIKKEGIINTSNIPQIVSLLRDKYGFTVITSDSLNLAAAKVDTTKSW